MLLSGTLVICVVMERRIWVLLVNAIRRKSWDGKAPTAKTVLLENQLYIPLQSNLVYAYLKGAENTSMNTYIPNITTGYSLSRLLANKY